MTPDPLQERVARALAESLHWHDEPARKLAAAVLADLREAGELREYEQVGGEWWDAGWSSDHGPIWKFTITQYGKRPRVPVYIVREDTDG